MRSMLGATVFQIGIRWARGPALGYSPAFLPRELSAVFTNIGMSYSAFPAAATRSVYLAYQYAMNISSASRLEPKTSFHEPVVAFPAAFHTSFIWSLALPEVSMYIIS